LYPGCRDVAQCLGWLPSVTRTPWGFAVFPKQQCVQV
jgi:hypothetical protein